MGSGGGSKALTATNPTNSAKGKIRRKAGVFTQCGKISVSALRAISHVFAYTGV
jgi:hypothetical protein